MPPLEDADVAASTSANDNNNVEYEEDDNNNVEYEEDDESTGIMLVLSVDCFFLSFVSLAGFAIQRVLSLSFQTTGAYTTTWLELDSVSGWTQRLVVRGWHGIISIISINHGCRFRCVLATLCLRGVGNSATLDPPALSTKV